MKSNRSQRSITAAICLLLVTVAACERGNEQASVDDASDARAPRLTADTLGEQIVLEADAYRSMPEFAAANLEYGERLSMQCRACHTFEKDGPHLLGPNLYDFFGRRAGGLDNFSYSKALLESSFVWTPRAMDAWLAAPADFLPGTTMVYQGMPNAQDRAALIASLLQQTAADAP